MEKSRDHKPITINNENGKTPISVGANYVMPGESRTFNWHDVPAYLRPEEPVEILVAADPATERRAFLAALLALPQEEMAVKLPYPSTDDLNLIEELESAAAKPRKDLLGVIAAEKIRRAGLSEEELASEKAAAEALARDWAAREAKANAGAAGNDTQAGAAPSDTQAGAVGNDTLAGAGTDDTLDGATGNDTLDGAGSNDTLEGGGGNDTEADAAKRTAELAEILKKKVGDVREHFSTLSDADLTQLEELEKKRDPVLGFGGPRKSLLAAIAEELKQRSGGAQ